MANVRLKKKVYPISQALRSYLEDTGKEKRFEVAYRDLFNYSSSVSVYDRNGKDTLWETLIYSPGDTVYIHQSLLEMYSNLKVAGDTSFIEHLIIDRIDLCLYGNTRPIRVRVLNQLNELFDYFYIKVADASRVYGMELEDMLSPNKINFLTDRDTIIEEHIPGVPGDDFMASFMINQDYNPLRVAKEFVKFNERCLVQLLGDMRNDNYVVEIIPDFDEVYFRLRAIDFDQQSYEGNYLIYLPQFFKENNPIINLGFKTMSPTLEHQYQKEERSRILLRVKSSGMRLNNLLNAMAGDVLAPVEHVVQLRESLAALYQDDAFMQCKSMGELINTSIGMLAKHPIRPRQRARFRERV